MAMKTALSCIFYPTAIVTAILFLAQLQYVWEPQVVAFFPKLNLNLNYKRALMGLRTGAEQPKGRLVARKMPDSNEGAL